MHQRNSLIIAIALSAFILVLIGSLAARLSQQPSVAAMAAPSDTAVPPTIALDPSTEALLAEREAAYQQALAEANQRIAQANAQVAQANARLQQASAPVAAGPAAAAPGYALSGEQAAQAAVAYRGGGEVREVQLENERGLLVYEVKFSDGAEVFIDAASGQVAYAKLGGDEAHEREDNDD
jgi:uncharacterized membrane protein YkoI